MIPECSLDICLRCGACVGTCPVHAMVLRENGPVIDPQTCTGCMACVRICPVGAIKEVVG